MASKTKVARKNNPTFCSVDNAILIPFSLNTLGRCIDKIAHNRVLTFLDLIRSSDCDDLTIMHHGHPV